MKHDFNKPTKTFAKQVVSDLSERFETVIQNKAKRYREDGLKYSRNEGRLRAEFGYLIDDDKLKEVLNNLYGIRVKER